MKQKLTSRKFWLATSAFLGSLCASIRVMASVNTRLSTVGIVCSMLSAAIYSAAEAYVDAHRNDAA